MNTIGLAMKIAKQVLNGLMHVEKLDVDMMDMEPKKHKTGARFEMSKVIEGPPLPNIRHRKPLGLLVYVVTIETRFEPYKNGYPSKNR